MDVLNEIRNKINEELGVSDIVSEASNSILFLIIKHNKTLPRNNFKTGNFKYLFQGKTINVSYDLYYVENKKNAYATVPSNKAFSRKIDKTTYILKTSVVYIKEINEYIDYNGSIQHEMEHIYQMIKSGTPLLKKQNSINFYQIANQIIRNGDLYRKIVGTVIYYACKFEKDAFVNGIYKQIIDNPYSNPYEILKQTTTYQNIQVINKYVIETNVYQSKYEEIVSKYFNKNYKWFYNLTNKVVKEYINKIGKVLMKAKQDIEKNNVFLDGGPFGNGEEKLNIESQ